MRKGNKMKKYQLGDLSLRVYEPENSPRAVVQVAHGMEEHQGRYAPVAEYLTGKGYAVVTADMRGHGESVPPEKLGFFAERDGYRRLLDDQLAVRDFVGERFPDLPVYLLAHSMGTIISRCVLEKHSERYDKVVLTGFPCTRNGVGFGIFLADVQSAMFGAENRSKFMQRLSTGVFNSGIDSPATEHDWICTDPEVVRAFEEDPLCGFGFTVSALGDLFRLVRIMGDTSRAERVKTDLPILLLSGAEDPCTGGEKGRKSSVKALRDCGFADLTEKVYPGMRHEIMNERGKEEVFADIAGFFGE